VTTIIAEIPTVITVRDIKKEKKEWENPWRPLRLLKAKKRIGFILA